MIHEIDRISQNPNEKKKSKNLLEYLKDKNNIQKKETNKKNPYNTCLQQFTMSSTMNFCIDLKT